MAGRWRKLAAVVGFSLTVVLRVSAAPTIGLPTREAPFDASVQELSFPSFLPDGSPAGDVAWRVARVGNGLENWLTATPDGRLVDLGGAYPRVSADGGTSWATVEPNVRVPSALLGFEGAVSAAPGGDIVGMTWGGADQVITYKYEAATSRWLWNAVSLHTPFFDRPLLAVVPGPLIVNDLQVPYISILKGGIFKDPFYISVDGLNYWTPSTAVGSTHTGAIIVTPDDVLDYVQPQNFGVVPLGGGRALHFSIPGFSGFSGLACQGSSYMNEALRWSCLGDSAFDYTSMHTVADSNGYLHRVSVTEDRFAYSLSSDAGASWRSNTFRFPTGFRYDRAVEIKANGSLGVAAILLHLENPSTSRDQDVLYRFTYSPTGFALQRIYYLGMGDENFDVGIGLSSTRPRFDFTSLTILPNGKVAASFGDRAHRWIALAIEP